ncbi:hypothetical protein [Streptomyces sp. NPDC090025]|uniref:hypothetical protein n=1 Tax=Streptomyces sp. NPDC090025 TaxID=3365922 RepID=UPI0038393A59
MKNNSVRAAARLATRIAGFSALATLICIPLVGAADHLRPKAGTLPVTSSV